MKIKSCQKKQIYLIQIQPPVLCWFLCSNPRLTQNRTKTKKLLGFDKTKEVLQTKTEKLYKHLK